MSALLWRPGREKRKTILSETEKKNNTAQKTADSSGFLLEIWQNNNARICVSSLLASGPYLPVPLPGFYSISRGFAAPWPPMRSQEPGDRRENISSRSAFAMAGSVSTLVMR